MEKGRRSRGLQRRGKRRIAKKDLDVRRGQGNSWEKEDCRGKKRIERRKVQLSPPKAKIDAILAGLQENVSNPAQDWRGGYVKLFGGKDDHARVMRASRTQAQNAWRSQRAEDLESEA